MSSFWIDGTWFFFENLRFWKNARVPCFKFPQKHWFWKCPPWCFKFLQNMGFGKSRNSQNPNLHFQPVIKLFDIYGKMDLEKLIWTLCISAQLPDFCWSVIRQAVRKPCFSTSIPRGQNPRFLDFPIPRFPSGIPGETGPEWWGNRPLA